MLFTSSNSRRHSPQARTCSAAAARSCPSNWPSASPTRIHVFLIRPHHPRLLISLGRRGPQPQQTGSDPRLRRAERDAVPLADLLCRAAAEDGEDHSSRLLGRNAAEPIEDLAGLDVGGRVPRRDVARAAGQRRLQQPVELLVVSRLGAPRAHGIDRRVSCDRQQPGRRPSLVARRRSARPAMPARTLPGRRHRRARGRGSPPAPTRRPSPGTGGRTRWPRRHPRRPGPATSASSASSA